MVGDSFNSYLAAWLQSKLEHQNIACKVNKSLFHEMSPRSEVIDDSTNPDGTLWPKLPPETHYTDSFYTTIAVGLRLV